MFQGNTTSYSELLSCFLTCESVKHILGVIYFLLSIFTRILFSEDTNLILFRCWELEYSLCQDCHPLLTFSAFRDIRQIKFMEMPLGALWSTHFARLASRYRGCWMPCQTPHPHWGVRSHFSLKQTLDVIPTWHLVWWSGRSCRTYPCAC
jgi:hypothetical protein